MQCTDRWVNERQNTLLLRDGKERRLLAEAQEGLHLETG